MLRIFNRSDDTIKSHPTVGTHQRVFRAYYAAYQLIEDLKSTHAGRTVRLLDIGGSHGVHARFFRRHGIEVDLIDMVAGDENPIFVGDYLDFQPAQPYDVIWSSHVLEHVRNVGLFLDKMSRDLPADGYCVASVPPLREERMAFNHISLWNPGMLLLNFGFSGFEMKTARVAEYGYNISIIARKAAVAAKRIGDDFPDQHKISAKHFIGSFKTQNWDITATHASMPMHRRVFPDIARAKPVIGDQEFGTVKVEGKKRLLYRDRSAFYRVM